MNEYLKARILRIMPGFIAALLFTSVVIAASNPHAFRSSARWISQAENVIHDTLTLSLASTGGDDVFPANPEANHANNPLWTIPKEFVCYLAVAFVGLFCLLRFRSFILTVFFGVYFVYCWKIFRGHTPLELMASNARFAVYFLGGSAAWLFRDKIPLKGSLAALSAGLLAGFYIGGLPWLYLEPIALTYCFLWIGYAHPQDWTQWFNKYDLSYGTYLYAFPIQQALFAQHWASAPMSVFFLTCPIVLCVAFLSWRFIEHPCLKLKSVELIDYDPGARGEKAFAFHPWRLIIEPVRVVVLGVVIPIQTVGRWVRRKAAPGED